jgi:hypothetical protein
MLLLVVLSLRGRARGSQGDRLLEDMVGDSPESNNIRRKSDA